VAAAAAVAIALALPRPVDIEAEYHAFAAVENEVNTIIQKAGADYDAQKLDNAAYAAIVRGQIIPKWEAGKKRLAAVPMPKGRPGQVLAALLSYMNARGASFELLAEAAETDDGTKAATAAKMGEDAEARLREAWK
jgi:hypothetical protein